MACFDWKIGVFQQTVVRVYYILKYLIGKKSGITENINLNFGEIRIEPYSSLPIVKILTFHIVTILIKAVVKNKNNYCYIIFLEKGLYKNKSNTRYFFNECLYIIIAIFR